MLNKNIIVELACRIRILMFGKGDSFIPLRNTHVPKFPNIYIILILPAKTSLLSRKTKVKSPKRYEDSIIVTRVESARSELANKKNTIL